MKSKIIKQFSLKKNPYLLFSNEKNLHTLRNSFFNIPKSSTYRNTYNKNDRKLTTYNRPNSALLPVSKSLKSITLSSQIYSNYIGYYSNLTQIHSFKNPRFDQYPLRKNKDFLAIKFRPSTARESNNKKLSLLDNKTNSEIKNNIKEDKTAKKPVEKKLLNFKYNVIKSRNDKLNTYNSYKTGKDFGELCDINLFEGKFLKKIGLKKVDMNNLFEEKQKNFNFFFEYIQRFDHLKNIFKEDNYHRNTKFSGRTSIKKENMEFKLDIYSLCFKFFYLGNNKEKESQRLYFPFILMPLFYLLDFTSFKVLLSEIIIFNKTKSCFEYIKENLLINILIKYINYISNSLKNKNGYINNITYNKKETVYPLIFDWIVTASSLNEDDEENTNIKSNSRNNYRCFKLKIVLPKIKFVVDNLNIKINKLLNKHIISNLLKNKFKKWELYIFFDLFTTKRFKIITNLIMLNKYYEIGLKKIKLNKNYKVQNKDYEFFLTHIEDNYSKYYTFIPFIILIVFGKKNKKFQKINLNMKESINLVKFGKKWGMINTLFKCMFFDKTKDKIFFKFELLEDNDNELYKDITERNNQNNNYLKTENLNDKINSNDINDIINEKEKNKIPIKYKDKMYEILLLDFTLQKIIITPKDSENKYYTIPQNILNGIFTKKDVNKIFNTSYTDISLVAKYIGENCNLILTAKESDNIAAEKKMIEEADIENEKSLNEMNNSEESENQENKISIEQNSLNVLQNFEIIQRNNTAKIEVKKEIKKEIKIESGKSIKNYEKKYSSKYVFPKGLYLGRSEKKRVSIANKNELNQNRLENMNRYFIKRRTVNLKNYN